MCFTLIAKSSRQKPKIAKNDIIVYKAISKYLNGVFYPLIINDKKERYKKGFEYEETTPFKGKEVRKSMASEKYILTIHGNCFHSCIDELNVRMKTINLNCKIVKMIIPKGALYYKNQSEYVSNKIIYP